MIDKISVKKRKRKRRVIWATIVSSISVAALVIVAFLSSYVGYFTISVMDYDAGITLWKPPGTDGDEDPGYTSSFIRMEAFTNATPYSLNEVNERHTMDLIDNDKFGLKSYQYDILGDGSIMANLYFAFTFYILNTGDGPAYYNYGINLTSNSNDNLGLDLLKFLRIRVYENLFDSETPSHTYMDYILEPTVYSEEEIVEKKFSQDTVDYMERCNQEYEDGTLKYFNSSSSTIISSSNTTNRIFTDNVVRYSFVMWLEGDDPECIADYYGSDSGIKLSIFVLGQKADE